MGARAHGHSRECPRRECPLARAHGHARVPGPCTLARVGHARASNPRHPFAKEMDVYHVQAQRHASEEEEGGSQGWPGARQPETDGVRAQRLDLRFAASGAESNLVGESEPRRPTDVPQ